MKFNSLNEFYFVQIILRPKDGSETNRTIKVYTIRSIEELDRHREEIIKICQAVGGRAYIHPTKRDFKAVGELCLELGVHTFISNIQGLKNVFSSACGKSFINEDKKWVVDIDIKDEKFLNEVAAFIEDDCEPIEKLKLQYIVPTVSGYHLITLPFNSKVFHDKYPQIDIHKNNPTLLYYYHHERPKSISDILVS